MTRTEEKTVRTASDLRLVTVLGLLCVVGPLSTDMYIPALPSITADLGATAPGVQLTLTAAVFGIGLGQLVVGPMTDAWGRRRPLMVGIAVFVAFSLGCSVAPNLPLLIAFRFLQALGGSAGVIGARAVARDLRDGPGLAKLYSTLVLVTGIAPVIGPVLGGQLLRFGSWRWQFVAQAGCGVLLLVLAGLLLAESLPRQARSEARIGEAFRNYRRLLGNRRFMTTVVTGAFGVATMFAYLSGSSYVLQNVYGLSAQQFSLCFSAGALAMILSSQLARIWSTPARVRGGSALLVLGSAVQAAAVFGGADVLLVVAGAVIAWGGFGAMQSSALALAMADERAAAGAAAAVFGAAQFAFGGLAGPLVGIGGTHTAVPLAVCMLTWSALTLGAALLTWRNHRTATVAPG